MGKNRKRDIIRAARITKTADLVGVSKRAVQLVLNGDRNNETVMTVFMELQEGENKLLQEVKKLVPFN